MEQKLGCAIGHAPNQLFVFGEDAVDLRLRHVHRRLRIFRLAGQNALQRPVDDPLYGNRRVAGKLFVDMLQLIARHQILRIFLRQRC